ncbi:MAG: PocR ligand-binding domain-containing protein [Eubacteriales bacterium]
MDSPTNILKLINFTKFQKLQNKLSETMNLAIITVDYKGEPLTAHSGCGEFCKLVRQNPLSAKSCQKCDSHGGLESVRSNTPYVYLCHFGLVDLAIPIIVENKYIGAVLAGQVKLHNIPNNGTLEQIILPTSNHSLVMNMSQYRSTYEKIPYVEYEHLLQYATLIQEITNYIVSEAVEKLEIKNAIPTTSLESYHNKPNPLNQFVTKRESVEEFDFVKKSIGNEGDIITPKTVSYDSAREVIQPILNYIRENPNCFITSSQAAILCNVSHSYFSKTFKKVMTVSYTEYITDLKIVWAKEFLVLSNNSIEKISDKLGFNSTSYFIKVFKKYENLTPTLYRKYYKS